MTDVTDGLSQEQVMQARPLADIASYHAHIYFNGPEQRAIAEWIRARVAECFSVQLGRWHDRLAGPHSRPMYQIAFAVEVFPQLVPWLMINRQGLDVLVHPNTLSPYDDHLVHALWLGTPLALNGDVLPRRIEQQDDLIDPIRPNTEPKLAP